MCPPSDDEVRQGLKTYSNWPTYPQLYANGELLGGLDVVKELIAEGELEDAIPEESRGQDLNTRLKNLINSKRVMLFMKGSPAAPQVCVCAVWCNVVFDVMWCSVGCVTLFHRTG